MGTKMKGLLKGLRYISQIFDEEKEQEMQIGFPTDVKHVAHIGWDGPSVDSPGWMKDFKSSQAFQSAPLNSNGEPRENPEIKWVSGGSIRRKSLGSVDSPTKDMAELPKSSRRHSSAGTSSASEEYHPTTTREGSTKSRQSRKNSSSSSDSSKPTRQPKESAHGSDSASSQGPPDIPKKSRRKKSKESVSGESSRPSRSSKANAPNSDHGLGSKSIPKSIGSELSQSSSLKPLVKEEGDKGRNGIS